MDNEQIDVPNKYVAFCDVLGFANAVEGSFDTTIRLYREYKDRLTDWPFPEHVQISVYSDSILVVSDTLPPLLYAIQSLWFATLTQDWLIRGGIAYGKYWEDRSNGNLFVVSDALTRAVRLESTINFPGVGLSPEIEIPLDAWAVRFRDGVFSAPLLHFEGLDVVNPFNTFWFASARMRVSQLKSLYPQHSAKYDWFLRLADAVEADELLVPEQAVEELMEAGVLQFVPDANE